MAESTNGPVLPYLYDAFISYRHVDRDRKWAEWLIEALESYRLPKALQDRGFPPRLRKIFRDVDEAPASSDLNDAIKQALVDSCFLTLFSNAGPIIDKPPIKFSASCLDQEWDSGKTESRVDKLD